MSNVLLAWTAVSLAIILSAVYLIIHVSGWYVLLFLFIPSIHHHDHDNEDE